MTGGRALSRYRLYVLGNSLNNIGNAFYVVVLPLLVYRLSGSSLSMAVTVAAEALSTLLLPLWGIVIDRASPRTAIVGTLLFQSAVSALLPLGTRGHWLTVPMIYGLSFLIGLGANGLQTAQTRAIPIMFPDTRDTASAGLTTAYTVTTVVGPLMAAAALAHHGEVLLLWINTVSFLAPLGLLPWTRIPRMRQASGSPRLLRSLAEGFSVVRQQAAVRPLVWALAALGLTNAMAATLAVYRLKQDFHWPDALVSFVFVALGLGSVLGTRLPLRLRHVSLPAVLRIAIATSTVGVAAMMSPLAVLVPVGLGLTGVGFLALAVARNLWLQEVVPITHLGRANTAIRTLTGSARLAGALALGLVAAQAGVETALALLLVVGALPLLGLRTAGTAGKPFMPPAS